MNIPKKLFNTKGKEGVKNKIKAISTIVALVLSSSAYAIDIGTDNPYQILLYFALFHLLIYFT